MPFTSFFNSGVLSIRVHGAELDQLLTETVVSGDLTLKSKILSDHGIVVIVTLDAKAVLAELRKVEQEAKLVADAEFQAAHPDYQNRKQRQGKGRG